MDTWLVTIPVEADEIDAPRILAAVEAAVENISGVSYFGGATVQNISGLTPEESAAIKRAAQPQRTYNKHGRSTTNVQ